MPVATRLTLELDLVIEDEPQLRLYAEQRYRHCWGDAAWDDLTARHEGVVPTPVLVYEAMVASSEAPPPRALGVRVMDYWAHA